MHKSRKQASSYQRGEEVGEGQVRDICKSYKLLCIEHISNKEVLYSIGNYIR